MGVYELIRRRCRYIVACDAGEDTGPSDENLAILMRLVRIDFGVRIKIDTEPFRAQGPDGLTRAHVVVGRVHYEDVDSGQLPGILVYVRISMTGDEPSDVQQYARRLRPSPTSRPTSSSRSPRNSSSRTGPWANTSLTQSSRKPRRMSSTTSGPRPTPAGSSSRATGGYSRPSRAVGPRRRPTRTPASLRRPRRGLPFSVTSARMLNSAGWPRTPSPNCNRSAACRPCPSRNRTRTTRAARTLRSPKPGRSGPRCTRSASCS